MNRDDELDAILVGGRESRPIVIADPDPRWPERFAAERERIDAALGARALRIEHIGSTSVAGLAAKPIIDVLVTVEDSQGIARLDPDFAAAGYTLRVREPGHRMYRTPSRDVHVHVWADADAEVTRHLAFRDQLPRSPADRAAYATLKRDLATRTWADMNHYADAKSELVEEILARAGSALVLVGPPGAGKSSVLGALTTLLERGGVAHGAIEAEALARGWPWLDPGQWRPQLGSLLSAWRDAGRRLFLVVGTPETASELRAMNDATISTVDRRASDVAREVPARMDERGLLSAR